MKFEKETQHQLVVVTVLGLNGADVAEYTQNLGSRWGVGRKSYNDGFVLLVAPNDRKVRIAVGYGLVKELPDHICKQIIDQNILPRFQQGDLSGGIIAGSEAVMPHLKSSPPLLPLWSAE